MIIKVKRLRSDVEMPRQQTEGAAGFDLVADYFEADGWKLNTVLIENSTGVVTVGTGLSIELPPGYEAQVRSRSGLAQHGVFVVNQPGTVDSDYRGEVKVMLASLAVPGLNRYPRWRLNRGERIAQLVIQQVPTVTVVETEELSETSRGAGGFGSTGSV
jgi:dUTP pyrophosphatase